MACQPGTIDIAKSHETTECTERTSGVASAARKMYALPKWCHCWSVPCQPSEMIVYSFLRSPVARSRAAARSGTVPR